MYYACIMPYAMYIGAIALALLKVGWTLKLEFDGLIIMALWFDF